MPIGISAAMVYKVGATDRRTERKRQRDLDIREKHVTQGLSSLSAFKDGQVLGEVFCVWTPFIEREIAEA